MERVRLLWITHLLGSLCLCTVQTQSVGTSEIKCAEGSIVDLGSTQEEYDGALEILTNVQPDDRLALEPWLFPESLTFLQLNFTPGDTVATVYTTKPLDADKMNGALYYTIKCTNTGLENRRSLRLIDINDNAPVFRESAYTGSVSEESPVAFSVIKVEAVDADVTATHNRLTYTIQPPAPAEFEVQNDGTVRLMRRLNYNTQNLYHFIVEARDAGGLNDTTNVTIEVLDFDNLNPFFNHSLYEAAISENEAGPLASVSPEPIHAQDGDKGINEPVVYAINEVTPNDYHSNFNIDANTGVISVVTPLDREEVDAITIHIKAAQQDDESKEASAIVSVSIKDVNDNRPEFQHSVYVAAIQENSPKDTVVLQVKVTDLDQGGFVGTFRIIPESMPFAVSSDGTITVNSSADLDREMFEGFVFQIEAREADVPNQVVTAEVNITLKDENDNSPMFGSSKYEGKVFRNQTVSMTVVKVEATDPDEGPNGQVQYSIDFGNEEGYFSIDENSGNIILAKSIPLMENTILQLYLYVTAKDEGSIPRSSSVLVEIRAPGDSRPQFLQHTYQGSVKEDMEVGTEILKVDILSVAPVVPVTLVVETEADKFSINQETGILSTLVKLDYETQQNYTVMLSLTDGTNRDDATVIIDVIDINDNSPVFASSPVTGSVPEDIAVGDNVTSVTATDLDSGLNGEVRYILQGGAGRFRVDPETGVISVAAELDRETQDEYSLEVVAQDQGRPSLSATATAVVTVTDVNDNKPIFSKPQYEATVSEHADIGMTLVNVTATDQDEGPNGNVTYRISKQEPLSDPLVFAMDSVSGSLTLAEKLDYSKAARYTVEVEATDGGSPILTGHSVVMVWVEDVNDKAPEFSQDQYDVAVPENMVPGAALLSVEVTDEDEGGFSKGDFFLSSDTFSINKQGVISLRNNASLDRERQDNYIIQVVAVDQPVDGLNSTAQVNISVLDANDNNPEFLPLPDPIQISERDYSASSPGEVCRIFATDLDIGENGRVSLSTSSYMDLFSLKEDGNLLAIGILDRELQDVYELIIEATDNGTPQRKNITTIAVGITDVNDNAPVFSAESYTQRILLKDASPGALVLTLSAMDKDVGNNSLITYGLTPGSPLLAVDEKTGAITLTSEISEVKEDSLLNLTATAQDHGTPPKSAEAAVTVHLRMFTLSEDLTFESSTYNFTVKENEPHATELGVVRASSGSTLETISYKLTSHTELFSVDEGGVIRALSALDKEAQDFYIITVEAMDAAVPPNTAIATVSVLVEDVNEAPVFALETYMAKVFSIAPFKFPVVKVKATDPDIGQSLDLRYSMQEPNALLDVEASSGQVYVVSMAKLEGMLVTVHVKATDPKGLSTTTEVKVEVLDSDRSNVVAMSLNQPTNTVEKKAVELQASLSSTLGWQVVILSVWIDNRASLETRRLTRNTASLSYISFIAVDPDGEIISAEEVRRKLDSQAEEVTEQLNKLFGPGLEHAVVGESETPAGPDSAVVIALGVLLALSIVAIIVLVTVSVVKFRRMKTHLKGSDQQNLTSNSFMECERKQSTQERGISFSNASYESERRESRSGSDSNDSANSTL